ncbi:IS3 family transposase [Sunxiuqinia sp. sy24]|uniref:IS3 family transposase n=1 Tax=Sunxiuqinia sp. sy24 TaxID=3461495 RepID=UPI004045AE03
MSPMRKKFDKEFNKKAIELSYARGNASEIADELGIDRALLYRWRKEFSQYKDNSFPGYGNPKMTDLERENARLQKELREARMERDIPKKGNQHLLRERWEIYQFISDHRNRFSTRMMCKVFKISKSGYYHWLQNGESNRWNENQKLLVEIKRIFQDSGQSYGSPRMSEELRALGHKVSRSRTARIMNAAGLQAKRKRKFKATTDSRHNYPIAPNLLNQNFSVSAPAKVWVSDITYIRTNKGWMYLTVIIDLFDRKVIGWAMSKGLSAEETCIPAWRMAVKNRPITNELIFHSDRGIQYACNAFTNLLEREQLVVRSMSRKGNCWDNAVAESFFKTIKVELVYQRSFLDQEQAQLSLFRWIETWYNKRRRHSALGYKTINEFEQLNNNQRIAA